MHQPPKPTLAPRRVLETFVKPEALPPRPRFLSSTVHGAFSLFAKEGPPQNRRFCGERRGKGVQRSRRRQAAVERNEFRPDEMGGALHQPSLVSILPRPKGKYNLYFIV